MCTCFCLFAPVRSLPLWSHWRWSHRVGNLLRQISYDFFVAYQFWFPKCLILTTERKMSSAGLLKFPLEVNRNINSWCHFIDVETKALMTILMMMNTFLYIGWWRCWSRLWQNNHNCKSIGGLSLLETILRIAIINKTIIIVEITIITTILKSSSLIFKTCMLAISR